MGSEMLFSLRKEAKMKSSFTQTCTRFSQFLKERRSLRHLDAFKSIASFENETQGAIKDVSGPKNNTANLMFSNNMENERVSLELFPSINSSTFAALQSSTKNMTNSSELPKSKEEERHSIRTPSMTIFYGGKVLVFNELPEDKAQEIMCLASGGTQSSEDQTHIETPHLRVRDVVIPQGADLPIARRVSLHRFMEKRKHRVASSAPYHLHNPSMPMPMSDSHPQQLNMITSLYEKQQLELKL